MQCLLYGLVGTAGKRSPDWSIAGKSGFLGIGAGQQRHLTGRLSLSLLCKRLRSHCLGPIVNVVVVNLKTEDGRRDHLTADMLQEASNEGCVWSKE